MLFCVCHVSTEVSGFVQDLVLASKVGCLTKEFAAPGLGRPKVGLLVVTWDIQHPGEVQQLFKSLDSTFCAAAQDFKVVDKTVQGGGCYSQ